MRCTQSFVSAIKTPYFVPDINLKLTTNVSGTANTWYTVSGLTIPFTLGKICCHLLSVNYQYSENGITYNHLQIGGNCFLPGGIGWKNGGVLSEVVMILQHHNGNDNNTFTFRTGTGNQNRGLEIKSSFNLILNGLEFLEFNLKRIM